MNPPYTIADDVDCAGRIWLVVGEPDAELEEEVIEVINGPSFPINYESGRYHWQEWKRDLLPDEPLLHATHVIGAIRGLRLVWRTNKQDRQRELAAFFPVLTAKEQFRVQIDCIEATPDGAQARASGLLLGPDDTGAGISFFISDWYETRPFWEPGSTHMVGLGIWAYSCREAQPLRWEIPTDDFIKNKPQDILDAMNIDLSAPSVTIVADELRTLMTKEGEGYTADEVFFRGKVFSCRKWRADILGWDTWDILVEVLDIHGESIKLHVVATEHALGDGGPPKGGQFIEGAGWLQGNLIDPRPNADMSG